MGKGISTSLSCNECAKFSRSPAIVVLLGIVPSCYHAFVGISWVQYIFLVGSLDPKFFLVGISLV